MSANHKLSPEQRDLFNTWEDVISQTPVGDTFSLEDEDRRGPVGRDQRTPGESRRCWWLTESRVPDTRGR